MGWSLILMWWIQIQEGYLRRKDSRLHKPPNRPGFQCQEVSTTSGCKTQWRLSQWKKLLDPQAVPLKELTHGLTYKDVLSLSSSTVVAAWKTPVCIQGETEVSGMKASRGHCPFSLSHRASKLVPYLRLHQPGQHCLHCSGDLLSPTQLTVPT